MKKIFYKLNKYPIFPIISIFVERRKTINFDINIKYTEIGQL